MFHHQPADGAENMILSGMVENNTELSTPLVPGAAAFLRHVCQRSHWSYSSQTTGIAWVVSNCVHRGERKTTGMAKGDK